MATFVTRTDPLGALLQDPAAPWHTSEQAYVVLFGVGVLFQLINVVGLLCDVVKELGYRCRHGSVWKVQSTADLGTVSVIVPCFMPNEHPIVEGTLAHLFSKLEFEDPDEGGAGALEQGRVTVYCVYNAPKGWEHPVEATLAAMDGKRFGPWSRMFRLVRVHGSKSKAANLNHIIPQLESTHTVIYDADHHPDPQSLRIAARQLANRGLDCVQGSTYIRSGHGFMGCMIDAEFFFNYFIIFRCLSGVTQTGFFGGSNAFWRTAVLQEQLFDDQVQTEDIEYSLRALLRNVRIGFCPEARSGELAPAGWRALWRQRRRWALGWDQVTLLHAPKLLCGAHISVARKVGLIWTFILRWVSIVAMLILAFVHPVLIGTKFLHDWLEVEEPIDFDMFETGLPAQMMLVSSFAFVVLVLATLLSLLSVERPWRRFWRQLCFITVFFLGACVPILCMTWLQIVSFWELYRGNTGGWAVTARAGAAPRHAKLDEAKDLDAGMASKDLDAGAASPGSTPPSSSIPEPDPESPLEVPRPSFCERV